MATPTRKQGSSCSQFVSTWAIFDAMIDAQNTFEPMIKRTFRIMRYVAVGPHQGTQALAEFSELDPAKAWLNDLIIAANEHTWEDGSSWRPTTNRCAVEFMLKDMELPAMRWWIVEDPGKDTP